MKHTHWPYTAVGVVLVAGAFYFSSRDMVYRWYQATGFDIVRDLVQLDDIFKRIHETCNIISIDGSKSSINFLTVEKFVGSEVGPLNFAYPQKWQGPYVQDNPTTQGKEYQIVRGKDGIFIMPGDGVKLPSGKVIGTDIVIDNATDITALIATDLQFDGAPLAIPFAGGKHSRPEYTLDDDESDIEA